MDLSSLNSWSDWKPIVFSFIFIISSLVLRKVFAKYLLTFLKKVLDKSENKYLNAFFEALRKPTQGFIVLLGFHLAINQFELSNNISVAWEHIFSSSIIILFSSIFHSLSSKTSILFEKLTNKFDVNIDKILIPFFSKILRFVIIALTISIVAQEWGFDVNGFVAGLGIGGLAIALAAKDSLSNLFAGIVIITEKPFSIGDWIESPSGEGVVEDISFRGTKIRTFSQALVTIPNSNLANESITNWSKMGKRRLTFNLGLTYNTKIETMKTIIGEIETMLKKHEGVHKETIFVKFDKFNENSLDIFMYFFTNSTVWEEHLNVKQDINFKILEIIEKNSAEFAFPTRTIYLEKE